MDELSYTKQTTLQSNPNEIEQIANTNTLPINPAILNKPTYQQSDNSISSNITNQGNPIQTNSVINNGNNIFKPILNESQKAYPSSSKKDGQKSNSISNEPNASNMIASKSIRYDDFVSFKFERF